MKKHLLFVCTANVSRSVAAASLFNGSEKYEAKSAGTMPMTELGGKPVTQELIDWADEIFAMSEDLDHHASYLREHFALANKPLHDLEVSNTYTIDPEKQKELKTILQDKLSTYLK